MSDSLSRFDYGLIAHDWCEIERNAGFISDDPCVTSWPDFKSIGGILPETLGRMDKSKAVTACVHLCPLGYKLARLIYTLITKGEGYVDQGQAHDEEKYRQRVIKNLTKRAEALGFQLMPVS